MSDLDLILGDQQQQEEQQLTVVATNFHKTKRFEGEIER